MKIKNNEELNILALLSNKTVKEVSDIIVSELLKCSFIEDTSEYWGESLLNCIPSDVDENELKSFVQAVSERLGYRSRYLHHFLCDVTVIGDGDCPICGGDMEVTDGEYKEVFIDYDSENMVIPLWKKIECNICKYNIINNY